MIDKIEINKLITGYKNGFHLKSITTTIKNGSITGLIGPNGSGKSTLLKSIVGYLKPLSGEILIDGINIKNLDKKVRSKKIAFIGQKIGDIDITVKDYLLFGRLPYFGKFQLFETKKDIEIIEYYANYLGIIHFLNRNLLELSGGEQQVVAICGALVQSADILLLDEPTAHLDINYQIKIMDILKDLNQKIGFTIVIVLHDLNLAAEYCDNLLLMSKGELKFHGDVFDVIQYDKLEQVYNTVVITQINPLSKKPFVIPISKSLLEISKNVRQE